MRAGIDSLLDDYADTSASDHAIVTYAPECREQAARVVVGLRSRDIGYSTLAMTPLVDDTLPQRLEHVKPAATGFSGNLVVFTLERDTMSHFDAFAPLFDEYGQARTKILRIISATDDFFRSALTLTPRELRARNSALLNLLWPVRNLRVQTRSGTDLRIAMDSDTFEWVSNRGTWRPGGFTILPAGEIATHPVRVDGVLHADGALNCNVVTRQDMRLAEQPLRIDIRDSVAVSHTSRNPETDELVTRCFGLDNGRRVGELGFGTNSAIPDFLAANSHLNERRPGLHLGFGQHNQSPDRVAYHADVHLDVVTDDATLTDLDSGATMRLSEVAPRYDIAHPVLMRDEDITGDCCSTGCRVLSL